MTAAGRSSVHVMGRGVGVAAARPRGAAQRAHAARLPHGPLVVQGHLGGVAPLRAALVVDALMKLVQAKPRSGDALLAVGAHEDVGVEPLVVVAGTEAPLARVDVLVLVQRVRKNY